MEIPFNYLVIGFLIVAVICYFFYQTANENCKLKNKIKNCTCNSSGEGLKVNKDRIQNFVNSGVKEFAKAQNLEELPKFMKL